MIRSQSIRVAGIAIDGLGIAVSGLTFTSTATAAAKPDVVACEGKGKVKLMEIILACGDGNPQLTCLFATNVLW